MTMHLLSVGDQVEYGTYKLHSRFARASNFVDGSRVVFLVAEEIGAGPLNVVVQALDQWHGGSLVIGETEMMVGGQAIAFDMTHRYRSGLQIQRCHPHTISACLEMFRQLLAESAPATSLACLIDARRLRNFKSSFERSLVRRLARGRDALCRGDLLNGIAALKGCGAGLTPSGDDFMAGVLIGMHLRQQLWREDWRDTIELISGAARGDNLLSNAFLEMARRGCVAERMNRLIDALTAGDPARLRAAAETVFAAGATSGADVATGLCVILQQEIQRAMAPYPGRGSGLCRDSVGLRDEPTAEATPR